MNININAGQVLITVVGFVLAALVAIVAYFLVDQNEKLNTIHKTTISLPKEVEKINKDVEKIRDIEMRNITQRLNDQQALLVALASGSGRSVAPEYKKLFENLLRPILKSELDKTNAAIAQLQERQSNFHKDITRLSQAIERQSRLAAASPFASSLSRARLLELKMGDTFTVPAPSSLTFSITNPHDFREVARDIAETYKGLGIKALTAEPKAPGP